MYDTDFWFTEKSQTNKSKSFYFQIPLCHKLHSYLSSVMFGKREKTGNVVMIVMQSSGRPASPCSTRISHRRFLQESRGRCRAEDAGWPRTPPLRPSASRWLSSCPSHSCSRQSEHAARRRRTGICLCNRKTQQQVNISDQTTVPRRNRMFPVTANHQITQKYTFSTINQTDNNLITSWNLNYTLYRKTNSLMII